MSSRDFQRFLRGVVLIAQEAGKLQSRAGREPLRRLQHHGEEIASRLPQALPYLLDLREPREYSKAHAESDAAYLKSCEDAVRRRNHVEAEQDRAVAAASSSVPAAETSSEPSVSEQAVPAGVPNTAVYADPSAASATLATPQPAPQSEAVVRHAFGAPRDNAALPMARQLDVAHGQPAPAPLTAASVASPPLTIKPRPQQASKAQPLPSFALPPRKTQREFREVAVPASPLARVWSFGSMAAGMVLGAAGEAVTKGLGLSPGPASTETSSPSSNRASNTDDGSGPALRGVSEAQAERLAEGLCRMRGAALKIGQMLSLSDDTLLPPQVAAALERVRTQADVMPRRQLERVLTAELGENWRDRLGGNAFDDKPVAAASIGQVHRAVLPASAGPEWAGKQVAVKIQYPGVAESIHSDLDNFKRLISWGNFLPKGLYVDSIIKVAREELALECDYRREAASQERFRALIGDDVDFSVPAVVPALSTRRVLTTTWMQGVPVDQIMDPAVVPQSVRDAVASKLLKLTLKELFEWRFMQTDPNWGNFFYQQETGVIGLLDFGACRDYPRPFVDDYLRLVWAAANGDRQTIEAVSLRLGFLTGLESRTMLAAHIDSGLVVGEPFRTPGAFDFHASGITARVARYGSVFAEQRLSPPPPEAYSLHRKLAGAFLICIRLGAVIPCRQVLEQTVREYDWGSAQGGPPPMYGAAPIRTM